jgi:predicted dehydrogenase
LIRVGLVGAGPWAGLFTAPMLASAPGLSLAAVWARRAQAAEALAHQHDAATVGSFEDLLGACDAVAFTVPAECRHH